MSTGIIDIRLLKMDRKINILLAEDNEEFRESCYEFLREKGFNVIVAVDGTEASYKTTNQKFDLILTDLAMPKRDGIGMIERIQNVKNVNHKTPIIVISGNIDYTVIGGLKGKILRAYTKPVNMNELVEFIIEHFDKVGLEPLKG
ncbi:MAG: response regulator [Halobacteriovoraceae bacterium]|nr:response regulator [Halobacteriovoraceae bacterium]